MVADLCIEQRRLGHDPRVYCLFHAGALGEELGNQGVAVLEGRKKPGLDVRLVWRLRRLVRKEAIEVVHSHNPVCAYYVAMTRLLPFPGAVHVNTRHNMGARKEGDRREKLFRLSTRLIDRVVMVSEEVARKFVSARWVPEAKARVQINGIPLDRYLPASAHNRAIARNLMGVEQGAFLVGAVGRLADVKNHRLLLQAFPRVLDAVPAAHLVLVGDGPLRADLEQQAGHAAIRHRVTFLGERNDVATLLPGFDLFVLPSLSEGHSIALLEAAASSLPAVATAVGGNPEIVQDGKTGLLVPSNDADALVHALVGLATDPERAMGMGRAARTWVEETASIAAVARGYDAIYREALSRSAASRTARVSSAT